MKIGIVGTTPQAETLARQFTSHGHIVSISDPKAPDRAEQLAAKISGQRGIPYTQAGISDLLVMALAWNDLPAALGRLGPASEVMVLDAMIPTGPVRHSGAEQLSHMMDNRHVVMIRVDNLNPGAHLPLCGDDPATKETVQQLLRDCGWVPTDAGALSNAADLEHAEELRLAG